MKEQLPLEELIALMEECVPKYAKTLSPTAGNMLATHATQIGQTALRYHKLLQRIYLVLSDDELNYEQRITRLDKIMGGVTLV